MRGDLCPSREQAKQKPDDRSGEVKGIVCQVESGSYSRHGESLMAAQRRQERWNANRRSCLGLAEVVVVD